ncbi:LuxR C-terminal-related transcriptional regulator [Epilithonimonas sp.]|uniref:LuxR C-terminal-related transcriptional regulator n=1 Tax=Epilithonimonas sp. TaxID=2894511 RepID=UPI002FDDBE78
MNFNFTRYFLSFFILFSIFFYAKNLNSNSIEEEIIKNNREGKHQLSQKKLSDILFSGGLTKEEQANILFLMATTYRSVNDYTMCINYLDKSSIITKQLPKDNLLHMKLDYEYAFVYFDNNQYDKSEQAMKRIAAKKYLSPYPEGNSNILMQEGYLFLIKKQYNEAEKKYYEALKIMHASNSCNLPIVYAKLMNLYSKKKNIAKAEEIYDVSMKTSDSCNILKYKIFAASEMANIYKENNLFGKAYLMSSELDSLRRLENQEVKISEMHIIDKAYTEKEQSDIWKRTVVLSIIILIAVLAVIYFYKKNRKIKRDKMLMQEELEQMKQELDSYSQNSENLADPERYFFLCSDELTDRQKELLIHLSDGLSNKEIAEKLFITENTVKYHTKNIYTILDIKDRKDFFQKLRNN